MDDGHLHPTRAIMKNEATKKTKKTTRIRRMLLLFMSAMFGSDEERGATESNSCNVFEKRKKKKKELRKDQRIKKGSHGTQSLEGGEVGCSFKHFANSRAPHQDSPSSELKLICVGRGCFPFAIVANTCTCRRWELRV
jgi:hypothetical protein